MSTPDASWVMGRRISLNASSIFLSPDYGIGFARLLQTPSSDEDSERSLQVDIEEFLAKISYLDIRCPLDLYRNSVSERCGSELSGDIKSCKSP